MLTIDEQANPAIAINSKLVNPNHNVWASPYQDTRGSWVICGYGRFGRALEEQFNAHHIAHTFISTDPKGYNAPFGTIEGTGTEAPTLQEAGIESALGVIAGTNHDADNLSIIITARNLNSDLITVALGSMDKDPRDRDRPLPTIALMLKREDEYQLAPPPETALCKGDQIVFCGQHIAKTYMGWIMRDHNALRYIQTGKVGPDGLLWRWLKQRHQRKVARKNE